jgi:hypothetical protein
MVFLKGMRYVLFEEGILSTIWTKFTSKYSEMSTVSCVLQKGGKEDILLSCNNLRLAAHAYRRRTANNPLQPEGHVNIYTFRPYRKENTTRVHSTYQLVSSLYGNIRRSF